MNITTLQPLRPRVEENGDTVSFGLLVPPGFRGPQERVMVIDLSSTLVFIDGELLENE